MSFIYVVFLKTFYMYMYISLKITHTCVRVCVYVIFNKKVIVITTVMSKCRHGLYAHIQRTAYGAIYTPNFYS